MAELQQVTINIGFTRGNLNMVLHYLVVVPNGIRRYVYGSYLNLEEAEKVVYGIEKQGLFSGFNDAYSIEIDAPLGSSFAWDNETNYPIYTPPTITQKYHIFPPIVENNNNSAIPMSNPSGITTARGNSGILTLFFLAWAVFK